MSAKVIFFKTVTSGNSPKKDTVLEFSGAAYDCEKFRFEEELCVEVGCEPEKRDTARVGHVLLPDYVQMNPLLESDAIALISGFLTRHSTVEKLSKKTGQRFRVARLAGHGVAKLDFPILRAWYEKQYPAEFLPADPYVVDLVQLESWMDPKRMATFPYEDLLLSLDLTRPLIVGGASRSTFLPPSLAYLHNSMRHALSLWDEVRLAPVIP